MSKDAGAANNAVGGTGLEQGDEREILRAVVEEVNRTGGVAGREVVPVIYEVEENSAQTWEQQFQAACTYWTEDEPVFVAHVNTNFTRDSVRACLNDRGVPVWRGGFHTNMDAAVYERFPLWVEVPAMGLGQISRTLAEDLADQDFFSPTGVVDQVKLGLVRYEPSHYDRATEQHLKPALARHGVEIEEEVQVTEPNAVSDVSGVAAQLSNAVLRFNTRGVTHVLFLEETSLLAALFMRQADPQEYRPRYGLHSLNGPQAGLIPNVPERQLHGAIGIGYAPVLDVPVGDAPPTPGLKRCIDLMEQEGIELPSQFGRYLALEMCETFFSLQAAGRGAGEPLSAEGLMAGLYALGDSYPSVVAPRTSFANQRRDGAAAYRRLAFVEDCTCFQYTSDLLPAR
ncbi:MAG: ABC transporter substrate-binding protein [Actinobacteria bacterium]|nr:ABC transporter substrate-binding protein [Actinomycetota bacterium]